MRQKQSLPIILVPYCYNYARLILDEIIKMSVNSGHYNYSNIALTLYDVDVSGTTFSRVCTEIRMILFARHVVLNSYFGLYILYSNMFALK
jgi:hypothetical protein